MKNISYTGVIVLNYNNYEDTLNCIKSILTYNTYPIKIVIVDNGSSREGTVDAIVNYLSVLTHNNFLHLKDNSLTSNFPIDLPLFSFIESKINNGYAAGNNKGLKLLERDEFIDYVMILNNDILFVQDIIPDLVNFVQLNPKSGLVCPILYTKDFIDYDYTCARTNISYTKEVLSMFLTPLEHIIHYNKKYNYGRYILKRMNSFKGVIEIELPSGSCMLISKVKFKKVDYFDSNTFLYYEENILFKKTSKQLWQNYLLPNLKCIHLGAQSTTEISERISTIARQSKLFYFQSYDNLNYFQLLLYKIMENWSVAWLKLWRIIK